MTAINYLNRLYISLILPYRIRGSEVINNSPSFTHRWVTSPQAIQYNISYLLLIDEGLIEVVSEGSRIVDELICEA